jgi:hypothetical protein
MIALFVRFFSNIRIAFFTERREYVPHKVLQKYTNSAIWNGSILATVVSNGGRELPSFQTAVSNCSLGAGTVALQLLFEMAVGSVYFFWKIVTFTNLNGNKLYIKIVALVLNNFVVRTFFIWNHFDSQIIVFRSKIWRFFSFRQHILKKP